jgi:surface antigen
MRNLNTLAAAALTTVIALVPVTSFALDLSLQEESALTRLTQEDKQIIKASAKQALNEAKDNESYVWNNPNTGHAGVITVLNSQQQQALCRELRLINTAGELTSTTTTTLCKSDKKWKEVTVRDTSTETNPAFGIEPDVSEMQHKNLSRTSERCQQLSQDIKNLTGKPLQRSAAMEQHQLECQRIANQ